MERCIEGVWDVVRRRSEAYAFGEFKVCFA